MSPLGLAEATPHAVAFPDRNGVIETVGHHGTLSTNGLGPFLSLGTLVTTLALRRREEGTGLWTTAGSAMLPSHFGYYCCH
jgi:hypothetical protein